MKVRSFVAYPSYEDRKAEDWPAYNATMALKGADFGGYSHIRIGEKLHRISARNTQPILDLFGRCVVRAMGKPANGTGVFILPSSGCVVFGDDPKAQRLAQAIRAAAPPIPVATPFRWVAALGKAAGGGGPRNADILRENMRFEPQPGITHAILVDDVKTTGGHLRAASRLLRDHGIAAVGAICFARTVWDRQEKFFEYLEEVIDD